MNDLNIMGIIDYLQIWMIKSLILIIFSNHGRTILASLQRIMFIYVWDASGVIMTMDTLL